jgi:hypothetical protein
VFYQGFADVATRQMPRRYRESTDTIAEKQVKEFVSVYLGKYERGAREAKYDCAMGVSIGVVITDDRHPCSCFGRINRWGGTILDFS